MRKKIIYSIIARLLVLVILAGIVPFTAGAAEITISEGDSNFSIVYELPSIPYKYAAGQVKVTVPDGVTIERFEWNKNFQYTPNTLSSGRPQEIDGGVIHTFGFASTDNEFQSGISLTLHFLCGGTDAKAVIINSFEYQEVGSEKVDIQVNDVYNIIRHDDDNNSDNINDNDGDNNGDPVNTDGTGIQAEQTKSKYFDDVDEKWHWAFAEIDALYEAGVVNGVSSRLFSPSRNIKRADFILMLVRAFELTAESDGNFDDVQPGIYYYDALSVAKALGIAKGVGTGNFNPESPITRQDMMVLVTRILEYIGKPLESSNKSDLDSFSDNTLVSAYAIDSVAMLVGSNLIIGSNGRINPQNNTTRAEVAVFLFRVLEFIQK